jgi:hypothetical protein
VENSATDARFATILKVFDALDAKVKFSCNSSDFI